MKKGLNCPNCSTKLNNHPTDVSVFKDLITNKNFQIDIYVCDNCKFETLIEENELQRIKKLLKIKRK